MWLCCHPVHQNVVELIPGQDTFGFDPQSLSHTPMFLYLFPPHTSHLQKEKEKKKNQLETYPQVRREEEGGRGKGGRITSSSHHLFHYDFATTKSYAGLLLTLFYSVGSVLGAGCLVLGQSSLYTEGSLPFSHFLELSIQCCFLLLSSPKPKVMGDEIAFLTLAGTSPLCQKPSISPPALQ